MDEQDWLSERFAEHRDRLRRMAYRMLGSPSDAEDAVQEAWLRVGRADVGEVENPAERLAFVLHDIFDVPFGEIAVIIDRSPAAARQLASRARRRVRGATAAPGADLSERQQVVAAFLAASRSGDFRALLALLAPEAVLRADQEAARLGASAETRGAEAVAQFFAGRAQAARLALVNGAPAAVWAPGGRPRVVFTFAISGMKITAIALAGDPDRLRDLDIVFLSSGSMTTHRG